MPQNMRTMLAAVTSRAGQGTVLLVDGYRLDRRLYGSYLDRAGFICRDAGNAQEALDVVSGYGVDVAVIDVCGEPEYGLKLIDQLQETSFKGPVLAMSADNDENTKGSALSVGAQVFLAKPIDGETLIYQINQLVGKGHQMLNGGDPIVSSLSQDDSMTPLLREFISDAREVANTVRSAKQIGDHEHLRLVCRQLKGSGGGYGFTEVTESAGEVIEALNLAGDDVERQNASIDRLLDVLSRVRAG